MPRYMTIHKVTLSLTTTVAESNIKDAESAAHLAIIQSLHSLEMSNPEDVGITSLTVAENNLLSISREDAPILTKLVRSGDHFAFGGVLGLNGKELDGKITFYEGGSSSTLRQAFGAGDTLCGNAIWEEVTRVIKSKYGVATKGQAWQR